MMRKRDISSKMIGGKYLRAEIVHKKGKQLVSDPIYNKGLAFPYSERDRLSIRGLMPPSVYVIYKGGLPFGVAGDL